MIKNNISNAADNLIDACNLANVSDKEIKELLIDISKKGVKGNQAGKTLRKELNKIND